MKPFAARALIACAALAGLPCDALAHAFGERYDLPAPLSYFMVGGAAVVALSFVAAALFARSHAQHSNAAAFRLATGPLLPLLHLPAGSIPELGEIRSRSDQVRKSRDQLFFKAAHKSGCQ